MAGSLKRNNPDKPEDVVLIRALRESNIPKFLRDDAELFEGIVGDLFPGIDITEEDYGILRDTAIEVINSVQSIFLQLSRHLSVILAYRI